MKKLNSERNNISRTLVAMGIPNNIAILTTKQYREHRESKRLQLIKEANESKQREQEELKESKQREQEELEDRITQKILANLFKGNGPLRPTVNTEESSDPYPYTWKVGMKYAQDNISYSKSYKFTKEESEALIKRLGMRNTDLVKKSIIVTVSTFSDSCNIEALLRGKISQRPIKDSNTHVIPINLFTPD